MLALWSHSYCQLGKTTICIIDDWTNEWGNEWKTSSSDEHPHYSRANLVDFLSGISCDKSCKRFPNELHQRAPWTSEMSNVAFCRFLWSFHDINRTAWMARELNAYCVCVYELILSIRTFDHISRSGTRGKLGSLKWFKWIKEIGEFTADDSTWFLPWWYRVCFNKPFRIVNVCSHNGHLWTRFFVGCFRWVVRMCLSSLRSE